MTDLEKVLAQAKYTALPLPREKSAPTTIYSFHDGQLFIVRDAHTCLPDPPLKVADDNAVDTLQFQREFHLTQRYRQLLREDLRSLEKLKRNLKPGGHQ